MNWERRDTLALAIPLSLALIVFAHAVTFPFVNWDDPSHFLENPLAIHPLARGLRGLFWTREIGYPAPILLLSFALDRALFGLTAGFYHAENVVLHLGNVTMLCCIAQRMGLSRREACAAATVFAIHPLVVEPVCWVTGRKDVLSTCLLFAACLIAAGGADRDRVTHRARWLVANVLAMGAVLVLPRMVVAPLIIVLLVHGMRPAWAVRPLAFRIAPAFAFAIAIVALGARQVSELGAVPARHWKDVPVDVGGAWALQLLHAVWPVDLLAYYFPEPGDPPAVLVITAALIAGFAATFAIAGKARRFSPARTGIQLVAVAYAPASCVFRIVRWTADSYMYVPMAGVALALVPLIGRTWPRNLDSFGRYAMLALAAATAFLSYTTTARYRSSSALWAGSIARYPQEARSYEHEALGLVSDGRVDEANALFRQLAERFPDWDDNFDDEARAYDAIGDEAHAEAVLARGIRAGSGACVRMYWLRLLSSPERATHPDTGVLADAFRVGFEAMKVGLHEPGQFRRVAAILGSAGLTDAAAKAGAHAEALERTAKQP